MRERLPAEVSTHVPSTPPSAASTWNVACCGSRPPSQSCPSCLGTKSLASDCCSGQSPEGSTLTQGKSRVGYGDITTARQLGTTLSVPFVTTLTLLSHFPQSATFLSASQQLPYPEEISLESPGSQGSGFLVLSRSAPEKSEAKLGLQKRTQAKWGCGLGRGRLVLA